MATFRGTIILSLLFAVSSVAFADYDYEYYEGDWSVLPDFDALTPTQTGTVPNFDISVRLRDSQYGFRFTGTVTAAVADTYTFYTNSDDGSQLFIDGILVVDNDGLHGPATQSGTQVLAAGPHSITVTFFEQGGGEVLDVTWSNSANGQQPIPSDGVIGAAPDSYTDGQWGPVISWPHVAVSAANLPDGRILTWSGSERDTWPSTEQTYSATWHPTTGEFIEVFHDNHNMFCAHLSMTEDGRVFVNGGRNQTNSPWTSLFDFRDNSWVQIENMASGGRWYPTTIALPDGDMLTAIGTATNQRYPDRWDPDTGWRVQNGIDFDAMVLDDYFDTGTHGESRWWPLLHVAPNGKIFHSGPTPQMHWINPTGSGSYESVGATFTDWYHKHGATLMYDEGKVLTAGGWTNGSNTTSTNQVFTVDLNGPTPVVAATAPMAHARKFQNGVMLPNGEVAIIGGNTSGRKFSDDGAVLVPEFWNPVTGTWREGAPMTIPRNYHSIALLLTDGRILSAGSGYNSNSVPASTHQDGQVYSPSYLFNPDGSLAARPQITAGPGVVEVGDTFNVTTSESVDYFSMIKMSSTTHGVNTDVRYLRPQMASGGVNSYDITVHANPNVATPGYWMVFAVNSAGVPSEAHVVRVTAVDTRLVNQALSGIVSSSSTMASGFDVQATNAIDGDLSGDEASGSLASTDVDSEAWWEIDLGARYDLDTIRLWNRSDCCADSLADFYVLISDNAFTSQDLTESLAQPGVSAFFNPGTAGRQTNLSPGRAGRHIRVQLTGTDNLHLAEVQVFGAVASAPPSSTIFENGTVADVGSTWQTVTLNQSFVDPVVIASAQYDGTQLPAVTRVRNASNTQFDLRVQNPSAAILSGYTVDYLVVEAGVYDAGGLKLEAVKFQSTTTDRAGSWIGESRGYAQTYANPVVVGQVMSENDGRWSVFWASDGNAANPPSATSLFAGKHVAEDSDRDRNPETIGYIVMESGAGSADGIDYAAGLGADIVGSIVRPTAPFVYPLGGQYDVAVVASAGMDGGNGGWPVLIDSPAAAPQLGIGIDEDQTRDSERDHTAEQVAYIAMTRTASGVQVNNVVTSPQLSGTEHTYVANASGSGTLQYSWNFGDGDTPFSTDNTAPFTFTTPGRHIISLTVRDGDGNETQISFTQLVHLPPTAGSPSISSGVIEYASRGEVWNVNPDNDSVTVIDPAMQSVVAEIPVPDEPRSLAIAPDGQVWVISKGAATVSVIDPTTYGTSAMYFLDVGSLPHGLAMGPNSAFIALEATGEVVSLDTITGSELQRTVVGNRPRHISLDATVANLYVSHFVTPPLPDEATAAPVVDDGTDLYGGKIVVLDPATLSTIDNIVLQHGDRQVSEHSGPGVPNYVGPAVISPDGTAAWVPSKQDNILAGALRGGQGLTFDQTVRAVSSKIELPARTENYPMRVDHDNASVASHAAFDRYGLHLFTALEGNREVAVTDVNTAVEILRFDVGFAPQGVVTSADGTRLYVHNFMDRSLGIYDISALTQSGAISVSELATVSTVSSETLSPNVLQGKKLFYDAKDDRLAALDYMSCASCHNEGSDDGRTWDFTGVGEGLRNTISLNGRAGSGHGFLHWSANFDEVQDFEGQIRSFSGGQGLMSDTDFNAGTRSQPLGDAKAGISSDLDALAAYIASLDRVPASPYRDLDGTLSAAAESGVLLFESAGCSGCHTLSATMTDSSDGSGLHDVGTLKPSSGDRLGGPLTGIDTPTVLGAWRTAPYLHDGSAPTLQSAISAHQGVALTATELDQLAALISELDDGREIMPDTGLKLATGIVGGVDSGWQTVFLADSYVDMVVIASPQYDSTRQPAVVRVRNALDSSFDVRVQSPAGAVLSDYTVQYVVVEAGIYNAADHGITMEAVKVDVATTNRPGSWVGTPQVYQQPYIDPVVVGQVMSENDARWSVFWASNGSQANPPDSGSLSIGKHIGEDPDRSRADETVAYLVIESGSGTVDALDFVAGRTANSVRGILQGAPFATNVGGQYDSGVASSAGMNGGNGGWPLLYGNSPLDSSQLDLGIDEDQVADSERTHTNEEVAYFLLR